MRQIARSARKCPSCTDEVEDERHALLHCPAFVSERSRRIRKLGELGQECNNEEDLLKLCMNPPGRKEIMLCTAVFV